MGRTVRRLTVAGCRTLFSPGQPPGSPSAIRIFSTQPGHGRMHDWVLAAELMAKVLPARVPLPVRVRAQLQARRPPYGGPDATVRARVALEGLSRFPDGGLQALLALGRGGTKGGVVARSTRQIGPSTARKNSRKRNWPGCRPLVILSEAKACPERSRRDLIAIAVHH